MNAIIVAFLHVTMATASQPERQSHLTRQPHEGLANPIVYSNLAAALDGTRSSCGQNASMSRGLSSNHPSKDSRNASRKAGHGVQQATGAQCIRGHRAWRLHRAAMLAPTGRLQSSTPLPRTPAAPETASVGRGHGATAEAVSDIVTGIAEALRMATPDRRSGAECAAQHRRHRARHGTVRARAKRLALTALGAEFPAEVLSELDETIRDQIAEALPNEVAKAVTELDTDDAAYIMEALKMTTRKRFWRKSQHRTRRA